MVQLGYGATKTDTPVEYLVNYHGDDANLGVTVASTARDADNTPTTTLQKGLVMGEVTATGLYKEYIDSLSDGTEVAVGILTDQIDLLDANNTAQNNAGALTVHGFVDNDMLYGIDANGRTDLDLIQFYNV